MVGESRAGALAPRVSSGSACRIFNGCAHPSRRGRRGHAGGRDPRGGTARLPRRPPRRPHPSPGRRSPAGSVALSRGTRLNAFRSASPLPSIATSCSWRGDPRVSILCTGEELRDPGSLELPGTIPDSNGPSLAALVTAAGAEAVMAPRTGDDLKSTEAAIRAALEGSDLLLTVGGVSVGEHDWVKAALRQRGRRARVLEGRESDPASRSRSAASDKTSILGVTGQTQLSAQSPSRCSACRCCDKLQGDRRPVPARSHARLNSPLRQSPGRTGFYRAQLQGDLRSRLRIRPRGSPVSLGAGRRFVDPAGGQLGARTRATASS